MKTLNGEVVAVSIGVPIKKKDSNETYVGWQLTYRDTSGKIDTISKPIQGLAYQPSIKQSLEALKAGDPVTIEMEKNAKNFWDIISIGKGNELPATKGNPVATRESAGGQGQSTSKYQTDRTTRDDNIQRFIIRQSSLAQAVNFSNSQKAKTADEVLALAAQFEAWVFRADAIPEVA